METTEEARIQKIRDIISERLELSPESLSDTSILTEDHAADSLSLIDILAAVEKEFGITIDQSDFNRMVNVKGVYTVVAEAAGW